MLKERERSRKPLRPSYMIIMMGPYMIRRYEHISGEVTRSLR